MRTGCKKSKNNPNQCQYYSSSKGRCSLGKVPFTCSLIQQPKPGSKKAKQAEQVRHFYGSQSQDQDEGLVYIDDLYR